MSQSELETPPAPKVAVKPPEKVFASRDEFLNAAGKFIEEEHYIDGIGWLVLSEIAGDARADIIGHMAMELQGNPDTGEKGKLDTTGYQRALLLAGVVDPTTPIGDRKPLFREADMSRVMKVGGAKIQEAAEVIERLSRMGRWQGAAEENSAGTLNGAGTSK